MRVISYATCQSIIGYDMDPYVHLMVFTKWLADKNPFGHLAYPSDFKDTFDIPEISLVQMRTLRIM